MTFFTKKEIIQILSGKKNLTIRRTSMKIGKVYLIKKDRTPTRYGKIKILNCYPKKLRDVNDSEAKKAGEKSANSYIKNHLMYYNKGIQLDDEIYIIEFEVI